MTDHIEKKDRILKRAEEMFLKSGYSKITMEEISANLGMSKKTLYKYFPGKEYLVQEIIFKIICTVTDSIDGILSDNETDIIEKLKKLMNLIKMMSSKLEGPLLEDLYKNIPELWQHINEFRNEIVRQKFTRLIYFGVEQGIFRRDIDHRLIVLIYLSAIKELMNSETLAYIPFTGEEVYESIVKVIFSGIFNEDVIIKKFNQNKKE